MDFCPLKYGCDLCNNINYLVPRVSTYRNTELNTSANDRDILYWVSVIFLKLSNEGLLYILKRIHGPGHAKMCLMSYANNKGADQPAHPHSLISTFIVRCLDSMICILLYSKFQDSS